MFLIGQSHKDSPHLVLLALCDRCAVRHMQSADVHGSEPKLPIPRVHRHQLIGGSGRLHLHTGETEFDVWSAEQENKLHQVCVEY